MEKLEIISRVENIVGAFIRTRGKKDLSVIYARNFCSIQSEKTLFYLMVNSKPLEGEDYIKFSITSENGINKSFFYKNDKEADFFIVDLGLFLEYYYNGDLVNFCKMMCDRQCQKTMDSLEYIKDFLQDIPEKFRNEVSTILYRLVIEKGATLDVEDPCVEDIVDGIPVIYIQSQYISTELKELISLIARLHPLGLFLDEIKD